MTGAAATDLTRAPARPRTDLLGIPLPAWLIGGAVVVVLLLVSGGYGFHRDELYFLLAGRHPAFGDVDQPPLTPLLTAAAAALFGVSPTAVRIAPAIAAAVVVLLAAAMARDLGGSRRAQVLAALVLAISGWLGAGHLDETVTFDVLFWTIATWLLIPLLVAPADPGSRGRWLAVGVVVGIALENKTLAISLVASVGAALLLLRRRDVLRSPWPWLAAAIAFVIWLPNLVWQATNGFPQIAMAQAIAADQGSGLDGRLKAIAQLLAIAGPLLWPVAIAGVIWLLRRDESRPWRPLGLAIVLQGLLMLVVNGKSYYAAGFLPLAIAAGSIPLDRWLSRGRVALRRAVFAVACLVSGALVVVLTLPIVPVGALASTPVPAIYEESVAQVGWPELARQVEAVVATLPPEQRATAVIVTADYGQYSALSLLGSGLPPVYSGHNSTWDWGRPPDGAGPVILVAWGERGAESTFPDCRLAATIDNGFDLPTQEQGSAIRICGAPIVPWSMLWPQLRHVN